MKKLLSLLTALSLTLALGAVGTLPAAAEDMIRVACVGDSITAGTTGYNYPMYLQEMLGDGYEVKNFGLGGAAVHHKEEKGGGYFWYDSNQYKSSLQYDADIVFVMMGTNDVGSSVLQLKKYFKEDYFTYLVQPYLDKGAEVVMMTSPFAYEYLMKDPKVINTTIRGYQLELAEEKGLKIIDMNTATAGMRECFPDGLHGNQSGYTVIAETIYKEYFKGDIATVRVTSTPGALVSIGRVGIKADEETGIASVPTLTGEWPFTVSLDGYKTAKGSIVVPSGTSECKVMLTEGGKNLALNCDAVASSHVGDKDAPNAFDGNDHSTRWESELSSPQWIRVDLKESKKIGAVRIVWEPAYAKGYTIDVSADDQAYTTVAAVKDGDGATDEVLFDPVDARYVRVTCTEKGSQYAYSIYEMMVVEAVEGDLAVDVGVIQPSPVKEAKAGGLPWLWIGIGAAALVLAAAVLLVVLRKKKAA